MPKATRIIQWRYRRQKREQREGHLPRRLLGILSLISLAILSLLIVGGLTGVIVIYAYLTRDLPNYPELVSDWEEVNPAGYEATKIYASSGRGQSDPVLIYEIIDPLNGERQWLTLDQIPVGLPDATVAIEEPAFWDNPRFGIVDISRALYRQITGTNINEEPASILQRLVDNYWANRSRAASNESQDVAENRNLLQRLLVTYRISQEYTKTEILEWYMNTVFYGNLAYGVEAASRVYFNKPVSELTLAEAAMLASIPQTPALNPIDDPEMARKRQEMVLEAMVENGSISRELLAAAQLTPVQIAPGLEERSDIIAPHFALFVRQELEERFGADLLLQGGLRIYTTLDLDIQRQAECVARAQLNRLSGQIGADLPADERESCTALHFLWPLAAADLGTDFQADNAAIVVMEAETAAIKAMVGSLDYWDQSIGSAFNIATDGRRQPGTALKPFIYLTALSQGYTPATMVLDIETTFETRAAGNVYVPQNEDNRYHGPMRLREALGNDYHIPAVQVMSWVGVDKVLRTARSLGITSLDQPANQYGLSLALGGGEVNLLDMVYAYNVMNNMGVMLGQPSPAGQALPSGGRPLDPVAILRVEDKDGSVLYEYDHPPRREILAPQLAYLINDMLSDRSARCVAFGCPNVMELPDNRPAAVVTGSTNDYRDAWTFGYTPQLVTGVWVGNSDDSPTNGLSGIQGAAPIWQALMSWLMQAEPVAVWTKPPGLVEIAVCDISGLLSTPYCPTVSELFIAGTQPTVQDNIYQEFVINRETKRLATIYTPPELVEHRIYKIFPEQVSEWALANGIESPPEEYDTIRGPVTNQADAVITWPTPFKFVSDNVIIQGTASGAGFESYRLAYFAGLTPANLQVIENEVTQARENERLGEWDVSNLDGLYTLLLTVVRHDGSFAEFSVPVTIDNIPPGVEIVFPGPDQEIAISSEWVSFRVQASDNIAVNEVSFYLDESRVPFATSSSAPFSAEWQIREPGCHTFTAVARDAAGNETKSTDVPLCLIESD